MKLSLYECTACVYQALSWGPKETATKVTQSHME